MVLLRDHGGARASPYEGPERFALVLYAYVMIDILPCVVLCV